MTGNTVKVYHLLLQSPAALYSTFTLREMELAVQLSCDRKKNHFIDSIGKEECRSGTKKNKAKRNMLATCQRTLLRVESLCALT